MQELDSPVMVIIQEHDHISPHIVHDHRETLKHDIYGLTEEMSEVLVFSPVGRKEPSLNLSFPGMSILQLLPNPERQILCSNPFVFRFTQRTVPIQEQGSSVDEHKLYSPKDLTLAAEESGHPPLPDVVVLTIKVWWTRTPFLVRHLWILD
jgi:hypothetical protein